MSLLDLVLACGERLAVHRFSIREAISSPFAIQVVARSPDPGVDLDAIVGAPAALRIPHADRLWSGLCSHARALHALDLREGEAGLSSYEITLAPSRWLLSQRTGYRIFQHLSVTEIAGALLGASGIEPVFRVSAAEHPRSPYRVQYGESDLDFLDRLLEEAGIAATDEDDGERSRLVLSDALHRSAPRRAAPLTHADNPDDRTPRDFATRVSVATEARPDAVTIRDHDFRRPAFPLVGEARLRTGASALERYLYRPGAFLVSGDAAAAGHHDDRHGARLAARALERERSGRCLISFETSAADLRPGTIIVIEGHPRPELDPRVGLLVTSIAIDGSPHGAWTIRAEAVPANEPYRPPLRTPKPVAHGAQIATVVGPPGQEVFTDEHGRVRVQFPWDREGQGSCWLRVVQGWAGPGMGLFTVPRVGQEVLVEFLAGDPDQPVVVGRLPNALNPPPLRLPDEQTQSVWRSATSPGGEGWSEIRLEDRKGAELLSLRAERDLGVLVRGDRAEMVGGDETTRIEGQRVVYAGQGAHITTEGEHRERIGGTRSLAVEGDQHQRVGGSAALAADGAIHLQTAGALVLEGGDVTVRGPGGFIRIDAGGVTIEGSVVNLQSGGAPGEGPGAAPAPPLQPQRADLRGPGPRRLPLIGMPGLPPMQVLVPPGPPKTPEEVILCGNICVCAANPAPFVRPSDCLTARMRALEEASGHTSKIKVEVPYDMSTDPPTPIMSKNDPRRATRGRPADSQIPDFTITKDGTRRATQDNIEKIIEVKIPPDRWRPGQREAYQKIAGTAPVEELNPQRCGCPKREPEPRPQPQVTLADAAEMALLTVFVIVAILNDALPGGQIDDVAIPPAIARILSRLAPLLRGPAPAVP